MVDDQVKVNELPKLIDDGFAETLTVAAGVAVTTVIVSCMDQPVVPDKFMFHQV